MPITAWELVSGLILFLHKEAQEATGRFAEDSDSVQQWRLTRDRRLRGICTMCGRRPVDYSISMSFCAECTQANRVRGKRYREKQRERLYEAGSEG